MNDDRYTRITLRLPKDLHERLAESADATSKSMNAEIVARLSSTFEIDKHMSERTHGHESHVAVLRYIRHLESRDELMDALDLGNPAGLTELESLIERAVLRALKTHNN